MSNLKDSALEPPWQIGEEKPSFMAAATPINRRPENLGGIYIQQVARTIVRPFLPV